MPADPTTSVPAVAIHDLAVGGDGVGRLPDGRVVFVRGAVPGDVVDIVVDEDKGRFGKGHVVDVVEAGPDRMPPTCPHVAEGCGGCGWQHIAVDAQRRWKVHMIEQALERIGRIQLTVDPGSPVPGLRTTARCGIDADGRAGFRAFRSHRVVVPVTCEVVDPALDEMLTRGRFGRADEVLLRVSRTTGGRLAVVSPRRTGAIDVPGAIVAGADELREATGVAIEEVVAGRRFRISGGSFFQSRPEAAAALVDAVRAAASGSLGHGHLVDLYGGVGVFAGTVGAGMETTVVESSPSAVVDARINLVDLDATVVRTRVEEWRARRASVVIADPPRAGLGAPGVAVVAATKAPRVVLVSCDAGSLGRDARLLTDAGYRLVRAELVDQFRHTPHVEVVSRFDKS